MKKIIISFIVLSFIVAGVITESYEIKGMHCQYGCANKVKSLMDELDGMKICNVDFDKSIMTVEYDGSKVNQELILTTLSEQTTFETRKVEDKIEKKSLWSRIKGIFG